MIEPSPLHSQPVVIVAGPTASGKTAYVHELLQHFSGVMVNADMGQLYQPLSIGTAKPTLSKLPYQTYGFDYFLEPNDLSASAYRRFVFSCMDTHPQQNDVFFIVGGSHFYLKSLFYPPCEYHGDKFDIPSYEPSWDLLHTIDPVRANMIHSHDTYRIKRALDIWYTTGVLPSQCKPVFHNPFQKVVLVFIHPERAVLQERIHQRTILMLEQGWVEEAACLIDTPWENFIAYKGLIGYRDIIQWIRNGRQSCQYSELVDRIYHDTIAYAKRQVTFWQSFSRQLQHDAPYIPMITITSSYSSCELVNTIKNILQ
ncbi:MAG: tRNA dimethylallyltransferase [candidate division TM6 bacterium GW2011_GWF2_38_10]|nr:MAG: tRNA dimethylallyltransferase [candidate division TM6 bacterium GW2011_GWF2_38_10]